jgi:2-keto-4-pentenoate hydratase
VTVSAAVDRLAAASRNGAPCAPVRDLIGAENIADAYRIQSELVRVRLAAGASRVGRKIGLTSQAVQTQLGVDQPDFGVLLDDMAVASGGIAPMSRLLQPRVEGEIAFRLASSLDGAITPPTSAIRCVRASSCSAAPWGRLSRWRQGTTSRSGSWDSVT